ncbi:MAG: CoA transferase [Myxococcota bacterium]|nr:CoA transferase [Myxococcota bacterium]
MTGRILADLGADVIQVEPRGGDPLRSRGPFLGGSTNVDLSLPFIAANSGKRSIELDLAGSTADRDTFRAALAGADVVLESFAPGTLAGWGLGYEALLESLPVEHPGLVLGSITPYGQQGPYAQFEAGDLELVSMGGNAFLTGDPDRPPLRCSQPTAWHHAGAEAAVGVLLALWSRPLLSAGQHVDVSIRECQLATLMTAAGQHGHAPGPRGRTGYRTGRTREIWRCADGWISYGLRGGPARAGSLRASVEWMDEQGLAPDWLKVMDWASFSPVDEEASTLAEIEEVFARFFLTRSMRELYEGSLGRRILLAPCNDAREILEQGQLRSRHFFRGDTYPVSSEALERPAFFARSSLGPLSSHEKRAAALDEHGSLLRAEWLNSSRRAEEPPAAAKSRLRVVVGGRGCLEGLRVLELGSGAAGPVATRYLAEQGATVVRVESRQRPDFLRLLHLTQSNREEPDILEYAPMFALLNPDKQSLAIDMKKPEGVGLVRRLILEWADVVAENFAPGVMERWGLTYPGLSQERPDLIMVSGSLFGQTGPQRTYPGFGGQGAAIAGFNQLTGWPEAEALGPYGTITDSLSPRFLAAATVCALMHARRTGEGQHLDISQIETGVYSLSEVVVRCSATGEVMSRMGNRSEVLVPHGIFPCRPVADAQGEARESWVSLEVASDAQWQTLVEIMGRPSWAMASGLSEQAGRLEQVDEIERAVSAWTRSQKAEELMERLQASGIASGVVRDLAGLWSDPQLAVRKHFVELEHPFLGALAYERSGFRLSLTPGGVRLPAPTLGQHTDSILSGMLGLSQEEIEHLGSLGVTR